MVRVLLDATALPLFNDATFYGLLGGFLALLTLICIYEPYRVIGCLSSTVGALSLRLVPKLLDACFVIGLGFSNFFDSYCCTL